MSERLATQSLPKIFSVPQVLLLDMSSREDMILIKPDDAVNRSSTYFSERIISSIMSSGQVDVIGLGPSISIASSAVNISADIANVHIHEVTLDYVEFPVLGKYEVIVFSLKNVSLEKPLALLARQLDENMKLTIDREGQLVVISARQAIERTVQMCLWKLSNFERVKILAAGSAITNAARTALTITKGDISREPVFIELISFGRFEKTRGGPPKPITSIHIYLRKGKGKESARHKKLLASIKSQIRSY